MFNAQDLGYNMPLIKYKDKATQQDVIISVIDQEFNSKSKEIHYDMCKDHECNSEDCKVYGSWDNGQYWSLLGIEM